MTDQKPAQKPTFRARSAGASFVTIPRAALLDARLTYAARGILAASMAYPSSIVFDTNSILANTTDERSVAIAALKELRSLGYLVLECESDEGNYYEFFDIPGQKLPDEQPPEPDRPIVVQPAIDLPAFDRTQRPKEPQVPAVVAARAGRGRSKAGGAVQCVELPDWMEPYQKEMELWQANRARKHPRAPKGITKTSLSGLTYARDAGVLREFCEHAAESCWQSLGFAGYRGYIDRLVMDKAGKSARTNQAIAPINYTLG